MCKKGALIIETHPGFFLTGRQRTHIITARVKTPARILKMVIFWNLLAILSIPSGYIRGDAKPFKANYPDFVKGEFIVTYIIRK